MIKWPRWQKVSETLTDQPRLIRMLNTRMAGLSNWVDAATEQLSNDTVNVLGAGATADFDGSTGTDTTAALREILTDGKKAFLFPPGDYWLGDHDGSVGFTAFFMDGLGDDLTFISLGARFFIRSTGVLTAEPRIFDLVNNNRCKFLGHWYVEDLGGSFYPIDGGGVDKGAAFISVFDNSNDVHIDSVFAKNTRKAVQTLVRAVPGSSRGLTINSISTDGVKYPFSSADNGDDVWIGAINSYRARRSYFVYGVRNHNVRVNQRDISATNTNLIKRYTRDTSNIDLTINSVVPYADARDILTIEHQNDDALASIIRGIRVRYNSQVRDSAAIAFPTGGVVRFASWTTAGVQNVGVAPHTFNEIEISGHRGTIDYDLMASFAGLSTPGTIRQDTNCRATAAVKASFVPQNSNAYGVW